MGHHGDTDGMTHGITDGTTHGISDGTTGISDGTTHGTMADIGDDGMIHGTTGDFGAGTTLGITADIGVDTTHGIRITPDGTEVSDRIGATTTDMVRDSAAEDISRAIPGMDRVMRHKEIARYLPDQITRLRSEEASAQAAAQEEDPWVHQALPAAVSQHPKLQEVYQNHARW